MDSDTCPTLDHTSRRSDTHRPCYSPLRSVPTARSRHDGITKYEQQQITSGQSNLTKGRFTAAHGRFNRIHHVAPTCNTFNTCFLGPTRLHNPNGISIGSAVFAGLTIATDRKMDHATRYLIIGRIYVRTAMRPINNSNGASATATLKCCIYMSVCRHLTAWTERHCEGRFCFWCCQFLFFLFVYEISREPLNGFALNSHERRVWSLARTSLKVKVKGQR